MCHQSAGHSGLGPSPDIRKRLPRDHRRYGRSVPTAELDLLGTQVNKWEHLEKIQVRSVAELVSLAERVGIFVSATGPTTPGIWPKIPSRYKTCLLAIGQAKSRPSFGCR